MFAQQEVFKKCMRPFQKPTRVSFEIMVQNRQGKVIVSNQWMERVLAVTSLKISLVLGLEHLPGLALLSTWNNGFLT